MFIGHFAAGLAAKPLAPRVPLPVLLVAPQLLDLVWPVLVATGVERAHLQPGFLPASPLVLEHYPYSHSLVATIGWTLLAALVYLAVARDRRGALVVGALVASHWLLDVASHSPDLPVSIAGGPKLGLGLWGSLPGTLAVELVGLWFGAWQYARVTTATTRFAGAGFWALIGVLSVMFVAGTAGPPPPSLTPLLVSIPVLLVVVVAWTWAIERGRIAHSA